MESFCPRCKRASYYRDLLVIIPFLDDSAFYTYRFTCEHCGRSWLDTYKAAYHKHERRATIYSH